MQTLQDIARRPTARQATLVLLRCGDEVLLIDKLSGFGRGKVMVPGGKREPGESLWDCARRELHEEVGLQAEALRPCACLRHDFTDGLQLDVTVFAARCAVLQTCSSAEARPWWCALAQIPYARMWADDRLWLPRVLAGELAVGQFLFAGEQLLAARVDFSADEAKLAHFLL